MRMRAFDNTGASSLEQGAHVAIAWTHHADYFIHSLQKVTAGGHTHGHARCHLRKQLAAAKTRTGSSSKQNT